MTWRSLTETVQQLLRLGGTPPPSLDLRRASAWLALRALGPEATSTIPAIINCAALAVSMRPRLVVHRLSAGVARTVAETDLHTLPGEPPRLLRGPWLLEARKPEEPLFGDTASLGGYWLDGAAYLVGLGYPDGVRVARWTPRWREEDLEAGVAREDSPLICDVDAHHEWAREAARFCVVLGLLLEAEGSPVEVDDDGEGGQRRARRSRPGGSGRGEWVVRRVYLSRLTPARHRASEGPVEAVDLTGRLPAQVPVRGHIKRQPYGPGQSLRRWIYVEGYEARRWVSPKPLRVEVGE